MHKKCYMQTYSNEQSESKEQLETKQKIKCVCV